MVDSRRESNGKKKGEGNVKCGNKYLAWAFMEAAHFAVRYDATIKRWYQKKCAGSLSVVALKAVAHKLARARPVSRYCRRSPSSVRGDEVSKAAAQGPMMPAGIQGRSNVRWSRDRSGAPDPLLTLSRTKSVPRSCRSTSRPKEVTSLAHRSREVAACDQANWNKVLSSSAGNCPTQVSPVPTVISASSRLARIISLMRSSKVPRVMKRWTCTLRCCPMR